MVTATWYMKQTNTEQNNNKKTNKQHKKPSHGILFVCLFFALAQPTWSILRRSGISETRKQHSCGDRPDSGRTCNALTVN